MKEKINQIRDILFIKFKLLNKDSNVIFLNEFKFASESTKYFGWSKRNQNGHLFMNPDKFNVCFMIAFSIKKLKELQQQNLLILQNISKIFY